MPVTTAAQNRRCSVQGVALVIGLVSIFCAATKIHAQPAPPRNFVVPPAPALSAEDEMKTFKIQPGFHVELVAKEPLVHDPVAITFDPDGRIWVCEMRGYMTDMANRSNMNPVGTISVLEDTDGDGKIDKSTVFLDKLR